MVRYCRLFNVSEAFSCKIGDPYVFNHSGIKEAESFSVISNLVVTTRITINYSRAIFFPQVLRLHLDLKITFSLQFVNYFSIVCLNLVLKSSEILPKS